MERRGWRGVTSTIVGLMLVANVPTIALLLTGEDPSSGFQTGFVYLFVSLGAIVALVTVGARVLVRAVRRARPLVTRRLVASSMAIGMLLGWPWPAGSELRDAPRSAALLVNTTALLGSLVWWLVEARRDRSGKGGADK